MSINNEYSDYKNYEKYDEYTSLLKGEKKSKKYNIGCFLSWAGFGLCAAFILFTYTWHFINSFNNTNFQSKLSYTYPNSDVDLTVTYSSVYNYSNNYIELENTLYPDREPFIINGETTSFETVPTIKRYIHRAYFSNLNYSSVYKYKINLGPYNSPIFTFTTPRKNKSEWNVLIYGDMGLIGDTTRTYIIDRIEKNPTDFFIHLGDIAYDMHEEFGLVGDHYLENMQAASSIVPYMTVAGNHENYNNFSNYYNRFTMPDRDKYHNLWYVLDKPPIKFINMNSESYYYSFQEPTIKNLVNFLNDTLIRLDRKIFPWVIVSAHRPMYCSSNNTDDCTKWRGDRLRNNLEELFHRHNVTIYMSAHEHSYERICPIYNGTCQENTLKNRTFYYNNLERPIHIVNGGSGNREGNSGFINKTEYWSVLRNRDKSYGVLYANYSFLNWTEYGIENNGEKIIDYIDIIKN